MLEKNIQSKIFKDLNGLGKYCEAFKVESSNKNGELDIFFTTTLTGAVFVEVKKVDGVLRRLQINKLNKLNTCGVKAFKVNTIEEWISLKKKLGFNKDSVIKHYKKINGGLDE